MSPGEGAQLGHRDGVISGAGHDGEQLTDESPHLEPAMHG